MEVIGILSSVNKISILAFFITLIFLVYEINLLRKEGLRKTRPKIPKFDDRSLPSLNRFSNIVIEEKKTVIKPNIRPLAITFFLMIIFGSFSLFSYLNIIKSGFKNNSNNSPVISFIASNGIKIFDENWQEIKNNEEYKKVKPGDKIYIGLETIKEAEIDKARIRINSNQWKTEDIINDINKEKNVFYKEYYISTGESKLKIEAQLHSISDGWLGE